MTTRETLGPSAAFAANIVTDTPASAVKGEERDLVGYACSRELRTRGPREEMITFRSKSDAYCDTPLYLQPHPSQQVVAWRYRYPNDEAWQLTQDHDQAFKNTGEVEPLGVIPLGSETSQQAGTIRDMCAIIDRLAALTSEVRG